MDIATLLPLGAVPAGAFADWTSHQRSTPAAKALLDLASGVSSIALRQVQRLCSAKDASWSSLVGAPDPTRAEAFLALMMAVLARDTVRTDAAATLLAALRCPGAAAHGIFHPLAIYELSKVLRTLLIGT